MFQRKPEISGKSRAIAIMYLDQKKTHLEEEIANSAPDDDNWGAQYDIGCLNEAIDFLWQN